ncbi:MAG: DUF1080 domain-containing protein [Verrucomicrobiales bacterium]|nr:DUF1080 domain-containing protein [Verrucomicrobiales bacterium]
MRFAIIFLIGLQAWVNGADTTAISIFDGITFTGWEGDTDTVWRIEDDALTAGSLETKQEKNNFLATTKSYEDFELTLKWKLRGTEGFVNGGVQFRSERIPNHHEVIGYQADLGAGYDGALYDESRRKKMLAKPDEATLKKAQKPLGEWNGYRIRAEGPRLQIWLNGVQTVDFTEPDPEIARSGIIAVQIHGNATSMVQYKDLAIRELDSPTDKKVIALAGGANIERTRFNGFLQTHLIASEPETKTIVRNFGWEGDTVFEQWRSGANDASWRQQRDWPKQLEEVGASTVIAQFGQMESLNGVDGIPAFIGAYNELIDDFSADDREVILVSPIPFESSGTTDLNSINAAVKAYTKAISELAEKRDLQFIDLTELPENLTANGYHLHENGHRIVAEAIAKAMNRPIQPETETSSVRREIVEMERLWFDYWRPMNWAFLTGDRTTQPYSKDWKDNSKRIFPKEMEDFLPLLEQAELNIQNALAGKPTTPIGVRSSIPVEPPSVKPQSPEEELASFKIMEGFAVNLFASEEDGVINPIQMRWDERGRLWVACAVSYPQIKPGEKANDYVLVCEDTDKDGRADKFHKYVEGLFMPSGLELGDGGLYVAQGTELLHFRDTDGDEKADTSRIVLGGFGTADSHQMINGLNWGFGGELWFTQGHHIYSRVETPYGVETLNRAGVWRYRPRPAHLDPFFQFSSAGANCWGVFTTEYGQPFHKSGANIGVWYSTPGLVRSQLAVNAKAMNLCIAPIKQVGMEFLHSSHFPKEMQGRVVIGGYYANLLEWHELTFENGMYQSTQLPNIIETKNNVFRPVEIRMGADGAIYVADWYNPIIGHYQASYRHPDRDKKHGRIWRVTWKNGPQIDPPNLADASIPEILEQVDSPERWAWYQSKRLLFEKDTPEVVAALNQWLPEQADDEYRRLQALSIYEAHETPRLDLLKDLLRSSDSRVRAYATRTLSTWARDGKVPDALALLETQIGDEDPLVRLEAIVAASYLPDARAAKFASRSLDKEFNAYHQHALTKTLNVTNHLWASSLTNGTFDFEKDEHLIFALQNGWVENRADEIKNHRGGATPFNLQPNADSASIIRQQVEKLKENPARQAKWLKALAEIATPEDIELIFQYGATNPEVIASINRGRPADPAKWITPLFDSSDPALKAQAIRLTGVWKVTSLTEKIRDPAFQENHKAALYAMVSLAPDEVANHVLQNLTSAKTPGEAAAHLQPLLSRSEGHAALMRALKKPDTLSPATASLTLQALNSMGRNDRKLAPILMKIAGVNPALPTYSAKYIGTIVKAANTVGNAAEGKKIYEQTGCMACHIPGGLNSKIGPDLSAISRGLPIDMIVTEVIWPALNIKEGYEAAHITLKNGTVVSGFKQTDTTNEIAVRDLTGEIQTIKKSEVKQIKLGGSLMPDGLVAGLSDMQLAHLVRYLSELGK